MARFTAFPSDDSDDDSSSVSSSTSSSASPSRQIPKNKARQSRHSFTARTPTPSTSTSSESAQNNGDSDRDDDDDLASSDSIMDEDELEEILPREKEEPASQPMPWAQQLDLEPKRVHVMQASLFRAAEEQRAAPVKDKLGFLRHRRSSDAIQDSPAAKPEIVPNRASFAQLRSQPPPRKYVRVTAPASATASQEGAYIDTGLRLGKSSRVGWGPGDKMSRIEVKQASTSCVAIYLRLFKPRNL